MASVLSQTAAPIIGGMPSPRSEAPRLDQHRVLAEGRIGRSVGASAVQVPLVNTPDDAAITFQVCATRDAVDRSKPGIVPAAESQARSMRE